MDDYIPIFSGVDITQNKLISLSTCGQFLSLIEDYANRFNLTEIEMKNFCQSKLSDKGLDCFQLNADKPWNELKDLMIKEFSVKLNIREKVDIRKKLAQEDSEDIKEYYKRCVIAQYLVSDDIKDAGFEREILLHFLIGLTPAIRDLVLATKCSSVDEYIQQAVHFQNSINNFGIKEEPMEGDDQMDYDSTNIKVEADPSAYEDYYEDDYEQKPYADWGEDVDYEPEIKKEKLEKSENAENSKCKCECGKVLKSKHSLIRHRELCMSQKKCKYCEHTCESKVLLKTHMRTNHPDVLMKSGWCKCKVCNELFKTKKLKEDHMEAVHGQLKVTCDICKESVPSQKQLALHIAKKHCEITQKAEKACDVRVNCLFCNKCTDTISVVNYHIMSVHFNNHNYKCTYCEKGFRGEQSLDNHIRTYHLMERTYQCDKCPKDFKTKTGLNHHITVNHTEQKNLPCDQCDKTFKNKIALYGHQHSVHKAENLRIMCDDCGKSFKKRQNYNLHYLNEHTDKAEKEKHFVYCQFPGCKYRALQKAKVSWHFDKIHLKMKDFACPHCDKDFLFKGKLEEHINAVHLNIKPHKCDLCDYATAFKHKVVAHKKVAHGEGRPKMEFK